MGREIYPAMTGGIRALKALDTLANNLANVNTNGFKADRPSFRLHRPDAADGLDPDDPQARLGAAWATLDGQHTDFSQGSLQGTGNATHLALQSQGFFQLDAPGAVGGVQLTRDGSFEVDGEGYLASRGGQRVLSVKGEPIKVQGGALEITTQGKVKVAGAEVAQIAVVQATDPDLLSKIDGNRFVLNEGQKVAEVGGQVKQFHLEGSNVSPVSSLTQLVALSRYYESFQKTLETASELDQQLTSVGRIDR